MFSSAAASIKQTKLKPLVANRSQHCQISAQMDSLFLREQPVVSLADPAAHKTFMADVFEPRPAFAEIVCFSEAWSTNAV